MRFIRDMISERAEAKSAQPDPRPKPRAVSYDPAPPAFDEEAAPEAVADIPMPFVRPAQGRLVSGGSTDRTLTRLSAPVSLDDDDVFKRLLAEDTASEPVSEDEQEDASPQSEEADNVFDDDWGETADIEDDAAMSNPDFMAAPEPDFSVEPEPTPEPEPSSSEDVPDMPRVYTRKSDDDAVEGDLDAWPDVPAKEAPSGIPAATLQGRQETSEPEPSAVVAVPAPASGRSGRSAGRVKTRLLGFGTPDAAPHDPFTQPARPATPEPETSTNFPVGWLVVISGPGRGASFPLFSGVSQIGRGDDQAIRLDFGDTSISRTNHAAIAYDEEQDSFYLGHGGKANMVRLDDRPVLSTEDVKNGALIRIGETTLRFVAFCDGTFNWSQDGA